MNRGIKVVIGILLILASLLLFVFYTFDNDFVSEISSLQLILFSGGFCLVLEIIRKQENER